MNEALVEEIAAQVVREEILANWMYWALLLAVLALASFIGNWLGAYAGKRGELQATDAKFNDILAQIRQSTHATEEIRSAISLGEWSKKEQTTLRRMKLEELLLSALAVREWFQREMERTMSGSEVKQDPIVMPKVVAICRLYFPELKGQVSAFEARFDQLHLWLLQVNLDLISAKGDNLDKGEMAVAHAQNGVRNAAKEKFASLYAPFVKALGEFELAAHALMEKIIAV